MKWVLALVCNLTHVAKAIETIIHAREQGRWVDDIVLVVPQDVQDKAQIRDIGMKLGVEFLVLPEYNMNSLMEFWDKHKEHSNYNYVKERNFQYFKFFLMHTFFKRWTNVLYLDSGIKIHGLLERLTRKCIERNVLYAHSDSYPTYEWKLKDQFCLELDEQLAQKINRQYDLNCNYFQSTIMIYDTSIIQEDTVAKLFYLKEQFPFSLRNDQGIFNLYFLCERALWRQLPLVDEGGYLYDYHNRKDIAKEKYLMLKSYH
jgi:hypothetical protein